tara:strand:+ start:559 stop:720 length:162 start_codon:yes stop_codon:yes gene_type:complete
MAISSKNNYMGGSKIICGKKKAAYIPSQASSTYRGIIKNFPYSTKEKKNSYGF